MTGSDRRETESGIEVKPVYTADDAPAGRELPGEPPFTRGIYPDMYRGRPWTMRQYAGFASAEETNARFRYLLERGQTGLSIAFDLPTQLGLDSDDPRSLGEVGRTGVAIDSLADMEVLLDGIPLDRVSTSMTINAPAALLLLLYELVAERQGIAPGELRGTVQNDILKEYIARGNYIFPPRPSMRLTTDLFAYCAERVPRWNTISISGYHIREAGSTAVQELAFTIANGIAYAEAAVAAGLSPDEFGERLSFFFNAHNDFFQEVAKFRAARQLWARVMAERFGATNPKALALRFHAQTGGSTLTAQQPENNIVRVAIQALSAVCGGAQSLHTNSFDEALALPSEHAATIALRTQQVLAAEAGTTATADPLGGSYYVEALTDELATRAWELIERLDELGGAVAAVESGWIQGEIEAAAYRWTTAVESGERPIVGVNTFTDDGADRCRSSCCGRIPTQSGARSSARSRCARRATRRRPSARPSAYARRRAARRTCSRRCARPSPRTARSASSAPCSARSGARTTADPQAGMRRTTARACVGYRRGMRLWPSRRATLVTLAVAALALVTVTAGSARTTATAGADIGHALQRCVRRQDLHRPGRRAAHRDRQGAARWSHQRARRRQDRHRARQHRRLRATGRQGALRRHDHERQGPSTGAAGSNGSIGGHSIALFFSDKSAVRLLRPARRDLGRYGVRRHRERQPVGLDHGHAHRTPAQRRPPSASSCSRTRRPRSCRCSRARRRCTSAAKPTGPALKMAKKQGFFYGDAFPATSPPTGTPIADPHRRLREARLRQVGLGAGRRGLRRRVPLGSNDSGAVRR